jgi:hypothetical protein
MRLGARGLQLFQPRSKPVDATRAGGDLSAHDKGATPRRAASVARASRIDLREPNVTRRSPIPARVIAYAQRGTVSAVARHIASSRNSFATTPANAYAPAARRPASKTSPFSNGFTEANMCDLAKEHTRIDAILARAVAQDHVKNSCDAQALLDVALAALVARYDDACPDACIRKRCEDYAARVAASRMAQKRRHDWRGERALLERRSGSARSGAIVE